MLQPHSRLLRNVGPEERSAQAGDAAVVAGTWPGVAASAIERYPTAWDSDDAVGMAYEGDEYIYGDCWQLVDFMAKLGLSFPPDTRGKGEWYQFRVKM